MFTRCCCCWCSFAAGRSIVYIALCSMKTRDGLWPGMFGSGRGGCRFYIERFLASDFRPPETGFFFLAGEFWASPLPHPLRYYIRAPHQMKSTFGIIYSRIDPNWQVSLHCFKQVPLLWPIAPHPLSSGTNTTASRWHYCATPYKKHISHGDYRSTNQTGNLILAMWVFF